MQSTVRRFAAMASLGLAIVVSAPATAQTDGPNQQLMNLVLQVQQLQDEVRMLRGQLDEQKFELESLQRRQRDQFLDLDQRINDLGSGARTPQAAAAGAGSPAMSATDTAPMAAAAGAPVVSANSTGPSVGPALGSPSTLASDAGADDGPAITERVGPASAVTAIAAPEVATSAAVSSPEEVQLAYDEAFQALKELRYADAAQGFQGFLDAYPDSSLAGNAQYWLGESYYVTRNYDIALQAFEDLLRDYPDSTKRGDGLLKIGFTHYELEQYDEARSALEQVQRDFPGSTLSRLAESRLRSMRLEGQF